MNRRWTLSRTHPMTTSLAGGPRLKLGESVEVMPVSEHEAAMEEGYDCLIEAREIIDGLTAWCQGVLPGQAPGFDNGRRAELLGAAYNWRESVER